MNFRLPAYIARELFIGVRAPKLTGRCRDYNEEIKHMQLVSRQGHVLRHIIVRLNLSTVTFLKLSADTSFTRAALANQLLATLQSSQRNLLCFGTMTRILMTVFKVNVPANKIYAIG